MSTTDYNHDAETHHPTNSQPYTTGDGYSNCSCTYWVRENGRAFLTDPKGEVVNLARLTAYAKYGEKIHDAQAHHEIQAHKIDAPAFLDALSEEEHGRFHGRQPDPVEVDGIPLLRKET